MGANVMKLFISYAHADAQALERLHKHLAVLRRDELIEPWFDRDVLAGAKIHEEIKEALDQADIFIALTSPDFLASNYCYEKEMAHAIKRDNEGALRIVPVILEPCEWRKTPLGQFKATPQDGKPISDWINPNTAYLDVATEIRRIVERTSSTNRRKSDSSSPHPTNDRSQSRHYRIKRDFDEVDKVEFRDTSFETICKYFEDATAEINSIDGLKARFSRTNDSLNVSIINKGLQRGVEHLTVHRGGGRQYIGDIYYSWQENSEKNSANGTFQVENDGYQLIWKLSDFGVRNKETLNAKGVAEFLWNSLLEKVGVQNA